MYHKARLLIFTCSPYSMVPFNIYKKYMVMKYNFQQKRLLKILIIVPVSYGKHLIKSRGTNILKKCNINKTTFAAFTETN